MSERAIIITQEIKDRLIKAGIAVDEEHIVMGSAEVIYLQSGVRIRIESQRASSMRPSLIGMGLKLRRK